MNIPRHVEQRAEGPRFIGGSGRELAHALRTHAVGGIGTLSRDLFRQDRMIPPSAVALDEVSGTIKGVGLGGVVTDTSGWNGQTAVARVVNRACRTASSRSSAHTFIDIRVSRCSANL